MKRKGQKGLVILGALAGLFLFAGKIHASELDMGLLNGWRSIGGFTRDLQIPDKTVSTIYLKRYLVARGEPIKYMNNVFGVEVLNALNNFRIKNNLPTNTGLDQITRDYINKDIFREVCPERNNLDNNFLLPISRVTEVPSDFAPNDLVRLPKNLVVGNTIHCTTKDTASALQEMWDAAQKAGISFAVTSSYRSYKLQETLYNYYKMHNGPNFWRGIAEPGHSEHQLGTTVDIGGLSQNYSGPNDYFNNTKEGIWLAENSYLYGFIMSYPKDKESMTGYKYEPWHYRYVGKDTAKAIKESNLTSIEYLKNLQRLATK